MYHVNPFFIFYFFKDFALSLWLAAKDSFYQETDELDFCDLKGNFFLHQQLIGQSNSVEIQDFS